MPRTSAKVLEIQGKLEPHNVARHISNTYRKWRALRGEKEELWKETRNYVFATDTKTTTQGRNTPWTHSTTMPKLCHIRDNLHANYMSAEFSRNDFFEWRGGSTIAVSKEVRDIMEQWVSSKVQVSGFKKAISDMLLDWIDTGNCFGEVIYVNETVKDPDTGLVVSQYVGPKLVRISPWDIVFDPTSEKFENSPKIRRKLVHISELVDLADEDDRYSKKIVKKMHEIRQTLNAYSVNDVNKAEGFQIDGFGSMKEYYTSGYVEVLEYEGDVYDVDAGKAQRNQRILVVDQKYILLQENNPSWVGRDNKLHSGWRPRPDNLYAMGPLENLVGMQYLIDHWQNASANAIDLTIAPPLGIKGQVDKFDWGPFAEIFLGDDGAIQPIQIDNSAFQIESKVLNLEQRMELYAGAPREAMGVRSPGEKTKFEVQQLSSAAARMFQHMLQHFEEEIIEPALMLYLEVGRRHLQAGNINDVIEFSNDPNGAVAFLSITKENLQHEGTFRPIGARHYARKSNMVQTLGALFTSPVMQDPTVNTHISGKAVARVLEDALDLEDDIVSDYVRVEEDAERARISGIHKEMLQEEGAIPEDPTTDEMQEAGKEIREQRAKQTASQAA